MVKKKLLNKLSNRMEKLLETKELEEEVIVEPKDEITVVGTKVMPSRGEGSFKWPAVGGYVSSKMGTRWGRMHRGIDIARPSSRSILAADNGVVISAGWMEHMAIESKSIITMDIKHCMLILSSINVKVGQTVPQGTNIGVMGSTGRSTGVHLHFEVTKNGSLVNPMSCVKIKSTIGTVHKFVPSFFHSINELFPGKYVKYTMF